MMKKIALILVVVYLIIGTNLNCTELTISFAGLYTLGDNLPSTPTGADNIINITVRDVVLDLGNRIVFQNNGTANVNGIVINNNVTDVTIQNGIIRGVTGTGLVVNQACSKLKITNLIFENCATRGISFTGAAGNNQILNAEISKCKFYNCCGGASGDSAIILNFCYRVLVSDCIVSSCTGTSLTLVNLTSCNLCDIVNVTVQNCVGSSLTAFQFSSGTGNTFLNCTARNNNSTGIMIGYNFNSSTLATITNCLALSNNSSANTCTDFNSATSTTGTYNQCKSIGNTGSTAMTAFNIAGAGGVGDQCTFIDCFAIANSATGAAGQSTGFLVNTANFGTLVRCAALYNRSSASLAIGVSFQGGGGTNWSVSDCIVNRNFGSSAANSFGVRILAGTNNFFTKTIAFNNNTTVANQLSGVPAGSVSTPAATATSNIASITLPATNMAIAA